MAPQISRIALSMYERRARRSARARARDSMRELAGTGPLAPQPMTLEQVRDLVERARGNLTPASMASSRAATARWERYRASLSASAERTGRRRHATRP